MINHTYKCIQVHIPKTAGITIRSLFYPNFNIDKHTDKYMHIKPNHSDYRKYWNEYFTFTFIRNPWERLVSCYNFCFVKKTGSLINKLIPERYPTFEDFVDNITSEQLFRSQRFHPQLWWMQNQENKEYYAYDFIGFVENIEHDVSCLIKRLGLKKQEVPNLNHYTKKSYIDYYVKPSMVDKVAQIYSQDIDFFNYTFEGLKK